MILPVLTCSCGIMGQQTVEPPAPVVAVEDLRGFFPDTGEIPGHLLKWEDDSYLPGRLLIVVDKKKQMMYVYRGEHRIAYGPVSTGKSSGMTPAGYFKIAMKDLDHHSYYGSFVNHQGNKVDGDIRKRSPNAGESFEPAQMPFFMRVNGAVGIHEGYLPGHPASHGCIRIPNLIAQNLFEIAPVGTRVVVVDGSWNIHALQNKPDSLFRTVHRPVARLAAGTKEQEAVGKTASASQDHAVQSESSTEEHVPVSEAGE